MVTLSLRRAMEVEEEVHDDIMEYIISKVPLVYLMPLLHVSKSWRSAVCTSLRYRNRIEQWLLVHNQCTRSPYSTTTRAYDPQSRVWIDIVRPSINKLSGTLRSSHSNLLYMLSPSRFSFSFDPLHVKWHHVNAPLIWRGDCVVAIVGHHIVIAGGTCDFEDDPFPVEIYDVDSSTWSKCNSMPSTLKDSPASIYLSIATNNEKLFVSEKYSGITYAFDPNTLEWGGPYDLHPDPLIVYSVIGFSDERLVSVGLLEDSNGGVRVKLWEVNAVSFKCEEMGEMPLMLSEKLKSSKSNKLVGIEMCLAGKLVYIYNPPDIEEVIVCEGFKGNNWKWDSITVPEFNHRPMQSNLVLTCSNIGMEELDMGIASAECKFVVKNQDL